jgi:hypothetical protein
MDQETELTIEVRSTASIAARLLILNAVVNRLALELSASMSPASDEDWRSLRFDIVAPLRISGIIDHASANERDLITNLDPVSLESLEVFADSGEALETILWAMGAGQEMPGPPRPFPAKGLSTLDFTGSDVLQRVSETLTRPTDEEAARMRETAELWHWRAIIEIDFRAEKDPTARHEMESLIAEVAQEAESAGLLQAEHGDFSTTDRPIRQWDTADLFIFAACVKARLHALNWLCGIGDDWDTVPLDL